ncbi:aminopeptidase P family protein [Halorubrum sp. 48-1-W]|uniref:M24 family metallopeptidase n=1 Tax=Halorubrum sp. 48-1-W TaxID=2249761 RepID=UPI000DCB10F6|nr:M24 family metallopeptidase [Halorubrum sp. 48-1-W]RAW45313.1 aminopeptidase P family protein [Halorubrum sp. 48-1-W]
MNCGDGRPADAPRDGDDPEPEPLRTDLSPVVEAVAEADATGFVAVGDRFDADLRYLTRVAEPDGTYGVVVAPASASSPPRAVLLVPAAVAEVAERRFVDAGRVGASSTDAGFHDGVVRAVRTDRADDPVGVRTAAVLDEYDSDDADRVLVPRSIPHDAAVYLERAGYDPASTPVVADSRAVKSPAEVDRIRRVQRATAAGMARAETVLAQSDPSRRGPPEDDPAGGPARSSGTDPGDDAPPALRWNDAPLTVGRLRRAVNATLAARGVSDAGNTAIAVGRATADRSGRGGFAPAVGRPAPIRAGETVVVELAPRGPDGYHGALTRTFVVDGDGGWERRAYVAVEAAREAALAEVTAGTPTATVHGEAGAELAAYGFDPNASPGEPGFTHDAGHGVGLSRAEPPALPGGPALRPGHVLAVEPGVYDPATGGVRLGDVVVVREDGHELLGSYPFGTTPVDREESDGCR